MVGLEAAPTATRGFAILKHSYDLFDDVLCERWLKESRLPVLFLQRRLVFERSSQTRGPQLMGEEKLQPSCRRASRSQQDRTLKPFDLNRVIVDTRVSPNKVRCALLPPDQRVGRRIIISSAMPGHRNW
ncbi:hypothetical protein ACVWWG_001801 [Bradyrhizobium sp. LB7.2]